MHAVSTQASDVHAYASFFVHENHKYSAFGLQAFICASGSPSLQMYTAT